MLVKELLEYEGVRGHIQPKTQNERKSDQEGTRAKRNKKNLPTSWDDKQRNKTRSWKGNRKTQYKK